MPSNFFTRAFGLHPTPQICFPPVIFTQEPDHVIYIRFPGTPYPAGGTGGVTFYIFDSEVPIGDEVGALLSIPGFIYGSPAHFANGIEQTDLLAVIGPPGSYVGTIDHQWNDGTTGHAENPYAII